MGQGYLALLDTPFAAVYLALLDTPFAAVYLALLDTPADNLVRFWRAEGEFVVAKIKKKARMQQA